MDKFNTLHDLIQNLTSYLKLTPEQQFRVTAKIKRYVHAEKADFAYRYALYSRGPAVFKANEDGSLEVIGYADSEDQFIHNALKEKAAQHGKLANEYSDEELVTWDVGTHKFRQERPPCLDCSAQTTGAGHYTIYSKDLTGTFCLACAEKRGLLKEDEDSDQT